MMEKKNSKNFSNIPEMFFAWFSIPGIATGTGRVGSCYLFPFYLSLSPSLEKYSISMFIVPKIKIMIEWLTWFSPIRL